MTIVLVVLLAAIIVFSLSTLVLLTRHLRDVRLSFKELWQLSIQAGMARQASTDTLHRQVDALSARCMHLGDTPAAVADIRDAATAVRPT